MRLLGHEAGEFSLTDFTENIPRYAILSHTWGADTEEVTYRDIIDGTSKSKTGYNKIQFCGDQAERDGLQYFWVDTCCIDKSNSTELQEAITSMFRWYHNAAKCYVYLSDVFTNGLDLSVSSWQSAFRGSRWFTRGWTIQELIAPQSVEFFCSNGNRLGNKTLLEFQLHEITGIPVTAFQGIALSSFSFKDRLAWAHKRRTKRPEDKVYSLLGLFDIHMPLIYGEGEQKAFDRLKDELYKHSKKRKRNEVSQASLDPPRRLKTLNDQHEPLTSSENSLLEIDDNTKQSLVRQLYFAKIDERLTNLTSAQGNTCRWFLTADEYISWNDISQRSNHGGFLWIKGHPGTGKSTLMKLLFQEAKGKERGDWSQITLSFFFLARGAVEERSTVGLYRSLLHQLFKKVPKLKDSLEWMTADGAKIIERNGWSEEALKQTLTLAIQNLGDQSLAIFVDALDECDINQTTGMVCFFEELCDCAKDLRSRLQICFSSRHYPTVVIKKGIEVILEDQIGHTEDIERYIESKLRLRKSKQADSLRSEILVKSSGIFLWVVLVLGILNTEYPNGLISTNKIRQRLKEIPQGLSDLFEMILKRDGMNLEQLHVCLKWILFATRPLKPQELYFAVQISLNKDCSSYWDQDDVDLDQIKAFIRSASKGLAEVTWNRASEVQFIHESVRDFLFDKYKDQWTGISENFVGQSHETLRDCCLTQMTASISQDVNLPDPLLEASKAAQWRETICLRFPFLEYSVLGVLYHANAAQQHAIDQGDFLSYFPLTRWIALSNALNNNAVNNNALDIQQYTGSASFIYILAERNLAELIRIHPQRASCFDIEEERYGLPLFAALAFGSEGDEAAQAFLEAQVENLPASSSIHSLWEQSRYIKSKRKKFGHNFTSLKRRSIQSYLAELGEEVLLACYLNREGVDADCEDQDGRTPLSWAASSGNIACVKLLLENENVDADWRDNYGRSPLLWAAVYGHGAVVELLLDSESIDADSKDNDGRTPLSWAASNKDDAVVKLLLELEGVDADSKGNNGRTPLLWAAVYGNWAAMKLLLECEGVNTDCGDNYGRTPLSWASAIPNGNQIVIKLLLEHEDVDVNSKDNDGRTPLSWATAARGNETTIHLLVEHGGVDAISN